MPNKLSSNSLTISLIVPTRNEEGVIARLLERARLMSDSSTVVLEIVVCDGGSTDRTREQALSGGAQVIETAPCRGAQLNAGAHCAVGDILWFVHADALPHARSISWIANAMQKRRVPGGSFRLQFDSPHRVARWFEMIARFQKRWGIYYGDSSIFVRRAVFEELGGFQEWPLFEDYDFARRLERYARQHGQRTVRAPLPIVVSARRFAKRPAKTLLRWLVLQILFSAGVPPRRLAELYSR